MDAAALVLIAGLSVAPCDVAWDRVQAIRVDLGLQQAPVPHPADLRLSPGGCEEVTKMPEDQLRELILEITRLSTGETRCKDESC